MLILIHTCFSWCIKCQAPEGACMFLQFMSGFRHSTVVSSYSVALIWLKLEPLSHFISPVLDWWMVTCPGCMLFNACPWMGWKKLRKSLNYWSYLQTPQNQIQWCIFWGGTSSIHTSYNPENPKDQCPYRNMRYNTPESWVRAILAEWQRPSFTVTQSFTTNKVANLLKSHS